VKIKILLRNLKMGRQDRQSKILAVKRIQFKKTGTNQNDSRSPQSNNSNEKSRIENCFEWEKGGS